jgi:hypothetical protein
MNIENKYSEFDKHTLEFLLLVAEYENEAVNFELRKAFDYIEELVAENGKLVKSVEDMEIIIKKGCACTRVWTND